MFSKFHFKIEKNTFLVVSFNVRVNHLIIKMLTKLIAICFFFCELPTYKSGKYYSIAKTHTSIKRENKLIQRTWLLID